MLQNIHVIYLEISIEIIFEVSNYDSKTQEIAIIYQNYYILGLVRVWLKI